MKRLLRYRFLLGALLFVVANHLFDGGIFDLVESVYSQAAPTTVVTGTITDPSGLPYSGAVINIQLLATPPGAAYCGPGSRITNLGNITADAKGNFTVNLCPNASITGPSSTQWQFNVSIAPGIPPPAGTGPQSCSALVTIAGSSQNISSSFSCPALSANNETSLNTSLRPSTVSDNFVRANANPINGGWTTTPGAPCGMQLSSNLMEASSSSSKCFVNWTGTTLPTSSFIEASLSAKVAGTTFYLGLSTDGTTNNGYYVLINNALGTIAAQVFKSVNGTTTNLGTAVNFTMNAGGVLRLSVQNSDTITLLINGVPEKILQDESLTGAKVPQVGIQDSSAIGDVAVNYFASGIEGDYRSLQSVFCGSDTSITTATCTFPKNTLQGSLIVCTFASQANNLNTSVVDSQFNKFFIIPGSGAIGAGFSWMYYALGIAGGPETVTINLPGAGQHIVNVCTEYFDLGAFDTSFAASATSQPSVSMVTKGSNELIVAQIYPTALAAVSGIGGAAMRYANFPLNSDEIRMYDATGQFAGLNNLTGVTGDTNGNPTLTNQWIILAAAFSPSSGPTSTSLNAPTIASGFGTSPTIASTAIPDGWNIVLNVGTGGTASSGVIGLPAAPNGWSCTATDYTSPTVGGGISVKSAPTSTTSVTITGYNATPAATAWTASDNLSIVCSPR